MKIEDNLAVFIYENTLKGMKLKQSRLIIIFYYNRKI